LGIETSCDETSVALLRDEEILANLVYSQVDLHARYGGVVPEVASRDHLRKLPPLVEEALRVAGLGFENVGLIGVTRGPGLVGPLLVGLSYAKGLAVALGIPLVGVNHLEAHIFAHRLAHPGAEPPLLALIVSGGHTSLVHVPEWGSYREVGATRDDAAGEALDKFGRLVGLSYPAGPAIDELAKEGDPQAIPFPRPMIESGLDFSFAGLKTAAVYFLRDHPHAKKEDLCAAYLEAVVEVLSEKAIRAAKQLGVERIAVVGGVAANRRLRELLPARAAERGIQVHFPPPELCTDNAAMVAACALYRHRELREETPLSLSASPALPLGA
ncbi:tRNA (adenosine(37)-N6)-threonylcarbamoyltransferase complex transferase subunit TsaD, partial [Candidatus Bipolaricaulota bacterium]|nr:tRNA (adenosine(37)-N6)-threonylcarbamoyltransferase complex transferase subunit TsaD [Candidatus Bipolaricaulota bacterium]